MKKFLLSLMLLLFSTVFLFACNETTFSDVAYSSSSLTNAEAVGFLENAKTYMINTIGLRVEYKTINTYTFSSTSNEEFFSKTIRDEITTNIGKTSENPSVATVETIRYVNNVKTKRTLQTYVKKTVLNTQTSEQETTSYLYLLTQTFDSSQNILSSTKSMETYDSLTTTFLTLFDQVILTVNINEVDTIYQKEYNGIDYYKLSCDEGLEDINDRFLENSSILNDPNLFQINQKGQDYVLPFDYEFGLNSSNYITYFVCSYQISNTDYEKYLTVQSTTNLNRYSDSISALTEPDDIDDYIQQSFVNNMKQDSSYISYKDVESIANFTKTTAVKLSENDFSVKVETYQEGLLSSTSFYYLDYQTDGSYKNFLINKSNSTYNEDATFNFKLLNFNFNLSYKQQTDDVYQYGSNQPYMGITMLNNKVYKISNGAGDTLTELFVLTYGINLNDLSMVLSLENFVIGG